MPNPFLRTPQSPLQASRKPSVVELLSLPPPLPSPDHDDVHSFSLSRHTSMSSVATGATGDRSRGSVSAGTTSGGVDWSDIKLSELTEPQKLISINSGYTVQEAFKTLVTHNLTSVPVSLSQTDSSDLENCLSFDYSDLNTYLLLLFGRARLDALSVDEINMEGSMSKLEYAQQMVNKAKHGGEVPVDFILRLHPKNPFIKFPEQETLYPAMEALGNGVHRVAITKDSSPHAPITGILSQRRLIKYMWENARRFPSLDFLINSTIQDLNIGLLNPLTIHGDQPLIDALQKMFTERVSSLAVIDRSRCLMGNISIVDVKHVSSSKNQDLLFKSVLNFISYNLSQKGIEAGQDQYPIFHVSNQSSLGRVIAKLVATQSHRLWVVESRQVKHHASSSGGFGSISGTRSGSISGASSAGPVEAALSPQSSSNNSAAAAAAAAASNPSTGSGSVSGSVSGTNSALGTGAGDLGLPGKLIGVVTLTDILGLFAESKYGKKIDPGLARRQRRRSSTSTRSSIDTTQGEIFRKSYTKQEGVFGKE